MTGTRSPARTLAGRYELGQVLGRGGMGTVYRATDRLLGREVAVKLLPRPVAEHDPTTVARFEREARAAAGVRHPNLVFVYDTGVDDDERYIIMELVHGRGLDAVLRDAGGPLAPERAAAIAAAVADGLAHAHDAGVIHRDIKPANIMVGDDGAVKVLDFGIARSEGATSLTQTATVIGTAAYLAPEVAAGRPADARSDVYALGCVLYAMLTGAPPFRGERIESIMHQHATAAPRSPRAANPRVPAALSAFALAMLEKRPADRPGSMTEVRDGLAAFAGPDDPTAQTRVLPVPPLSATRVVRSHTRIGPLVAILGVLLAVVAILASTGGGGSLRAATTGRRHHAASTASAAARRPRSSTTASTATTAPVTPASTTASTTTTPSFADAANALASQIAADVQSGAIQPDQAKHLTDQLQHVMDQIAAGHLDGIAGQLATITTQLQQLTAGGPPGPPGKHKGHGHGNGDGQGNGD